MTRHVLLVVEGPHDEAFVAAILRTSLGLSPVRKVTELDAFWKRLVPTTFPYKGDLRRRVSVPQFYFGQEISVAVHVADGDSGLAIQGADSLSSLGAPVDAIGFVLDSDKKQAASQRFEALQQDLLRHREWLPMVPTKLATIALGPPACGIFVLPDNETQGTLEDLLVQCAQVSYSAAFGKAQGYVAQVDPDSFEAGELKELEKNAGRRKAEVAALGAILKPGKSIQVSIQDNRWITEQTLQLPQVRAFAEFLIQLSRGA